MKTSAFKTILLVVSGVLFSATPRVAAETAQVAPPPLKLQVNIPPTWHLLTDKGLNEKLATRAREVFQKEGFERSVEPLRSIDDASRVPYLLSINVATWWIDRMGNVDCTFSASLRTPRGTRELGLYTTSTLSVFDFNASFADLNGDALRELYRDLANAEASDSRNDRTLSE